MLLCGMVVVPARAMVMAMMMVATIVLLLSVTVMIVSARRMVVVIMAMGGMSMRGWSRLLSLHTAGSVAKLGHALLDLGDFGLRLVECQRQRLICDGQGNPGDTR
ncbi:hypothetical protein BB934_42095 (plasmid) [Microvirga ossetica]|uniref:Uncharacterized protein n=1 Tax=Microvirga ossetica TaxID=1882682 RepID=A0A1B2EXM7_9HYPH|nr:hypothetical protein BB934_42095 [Microvirga ossetica]